jgi:hypothetical protein
LPKLLNAAQRIDVPPNDASSPPSSLPLKPPAKGVLTRQPETPLWSAQDIEVGNESVKELAIEDQGEENVLCGYHDDLSAIIKEARSLQHIVSKPTLTTTKNKKLKLGNDSHLISKMTKTLPTYLRPMLQAPLQKKILPIMQPYPRSPKPGKIIFNAWESTMVSVATQTLTPKP